MEKLHYTNLLKKFSYKMRDTGESSFVFDDFNLDETHPDYINYIDISVDDEKMLSFIDKRKMGEAQAYAKKGEPGENCDCTDCTALRMFRYEHRIKSKPGRVFKRIFDAAGSPLSSDQIATMVRKWYSFIGIDTGNYTFELLKGEDIRNAYYYENYADCQGETINSCMSDDDSQPYLDIYVKNTKQVQLAVLKNSDGKIAARSLVWNNKFYDRLYANSVYNEDLLRKHLVEHEFKDVYNERGLCKYIELDHADFEEYPYLDTFYCICVPENRAYNYMPNHKVIRQCMCTCGEWEDCGNEFECSDCGETIHDEDDVHYVYGTAYCSDCVRYSEYYSEDIPQRDAVWSQCQDTYLYVSDSVWLKYSDDYCHKDDVTELYDGAYAYDSDDNLVRLHNDDYALFDEHNVTEIGDGSGEYALSEDVTECYDGFYYLTDDCVELADGEYASKNDHDIVRCYDETWMLEKDTVTTYNGLIAAKSDCTKQKDKTWALDCDLVNDSDNIQELKTGTI